MRRTIARLLGARRLRRRAPQRLRRCSSAPATARYVPFVPAGRRYPERSGDAADDPACLAHSLLDLGRVASRPGYPAEPAARSRPFGRVSLAPPLASLSARSACPACPPHSRTTPCFRRSASRALTRRGGCPPVPFPEPLSLSFGTLGLVLWTPFGGSALTPHASLMPGAPYLRSGAQECAGLRHSMINPAESSSCHAGKSSVSLTAPFSQFDCTDKLLIFRIKTENHGSLTSAGMLSQFHVQSI